MACSISDMMYSYGCARVHICLFNYQSSNISPCDKLLLWLASPVGWMGVAQSNTGIRNPYTTKYTCVLNIWPSHITANETQQITMMTSWHGNSFGINGPLGGKSSRYWFIHRNSAINMAFWYFMLAYTCSWTSSWVTDRSDAHVIWL